MDAIIASRVGEILDRIPHGLSFKERAKQLLGEEAVERDFVSDHSNGVAYFAQKLARFIDMDPERVAEIKFAAILHDIGKLAIPDSVLRKKGTLHRDEMAVMKQHAEAGAVLLGPDAPAVVHDVAKYHHERYDGLGYFGLKGEEIPFEARIVQIADVHDALIKPRDYKPGMSEEKALRLMTQEPEDRGNFGRFGFDPFLLRKFVLMRLVDVHFNAVLSSEGKQELRAYAKSAPMSDFETDLADGWLISPMGSRTLKYQDPRTGNWKTAEVRNVCDELLAGPFGPRADHPRYQQHEAPAQDEQYTGTYRY